jgi:hypothetical protein
MSKPSATTLATPRWQNIMVEHFLIDAHVHLHHPARALEDLELAARNFAGVDENATLGVLMLAERAGYDVFRQLAVELPAAGPDAVWYESESQRLLVVAGRQIVTREGLEILGLGTQSSIPDGLSAHGVLARLRNSDALVVLPWGVGKWLGKRGRIVNELIEEAPAGQLFLGDNGGRPAWWSVPQFSRKIRVLAGSDPLPLAGSSADIGRFGSRVSGTLDESHPVANLKQLLHDPHTKVSTYGRLAPSLRFFSDQARLRLRRSRNRNRMEFA